MKAYAPNDGRKCGVYVSDSGVAAQFFGYDLNGKSFWLHMMQIGSTVSYDVHRIESSGFHAGTAELGPVVGRAVLTPAGDGYVFTLSVRSSALGGENFSPPPPADLEFVADLYLVE